MFKELLGRQIVPAQDQQHRSGEAAQAIGHALLEAARIPSRLACAACEAQIGAQAAQCRKAHAAAQQLQPERALPQPPPVIVFDLGLRQRCGRAYPGVEQRQARHAHVPRGLDVKQRGRCSVAQAPQHDALHCRACRHQCANRCADIGLNAEEVPGLAGTVAHAAVVESQGGNTLNRQPAGQQGELAVAAGPVLRAAHDDDDADRASQVLRLGQDAHQRQAFAAEFEHGLLHASASTVAATSAGATSISTVAQNAGPCTICGRAAHPASVQV
mmetsp:Transcript_4855/g.17300  ORF Transcript_4855/g.17300 Transcript_4855/m.17300 type:complete len:272 (-) Transcript_4855:2269-3084(-)